MHRGSCCTNYGSFPTEAMAFISVNITSDSFMNPYNYYTNNSAYNSFGNYFYITPESNYFVIYMSNTNISEDDIQCDIRVIL